MVFYSLLLLPIRFISKRSLNAKYIDIVSCHVYSNSKPGKTTKWSVRKNHSYILFFLLSINNRLFFLIVRHLSCQISSLIFHSHLMLLVILHKQKWEASVCQAIDRKQWILLNRHVYKIAVYKITDHIIIIIKDIFIVIILLFLFLDFSHGWSI